MPTIYFHGEDVDVPDFINEKDISHWLKTIAEIEGQEIGELNYVFCSDSYLLEINKQYLQHDYYTDIITFDYSEAGVLSGDVFISVERVRENADHFQANFEVELCRVIAHGCLHLIGYADKSAEQQKLMTMKEEASLSLYQKLSVPRGTPGERPK